MDLDTIQAVASLVAGVTGLTALVVAFDLERARRRDADRDRLLDRRLAACHDFLTVCETRTRLLIAVAAELDRIPEGPHSSLLPGPADAMDAAIIGIELVARPLVPAATLVVQRTKDLDALVRERRVQPHDPFLIRRTNDASSAWAGARDAFVVAAVHELGTGTRR